MSDIYRLPASRGRSHLIYVRVVWRSHNWLYFARVFPQKVEGVITGFVEAILHADGELVSEHLRIKYRKWKPELMIETDNGFIREKML